MSGPGATVIKVGGSLLRDEDAYATVSGLLAPVIRAGPTWVVVSAAFGVTDALVRLSRRDGPPDLQPLLERHARLAGGTGDPGLAEELRCGVSSALSGPPDRLLAWGERASAGALRAHLDRQGLRMPLVELGTDTSPPRYPSALVPGFYLRGPGGEVRCLPRGGSDLSAILLARDLGITTVRLWKAGGGVRLDGATVSEIDAGDLLTRLTDPRRPIHTGSLRLARAWGIDMVLEDPTGGRPSTRVRARGRDPGVPEDAAPGPTRPRNAEGGRWATGGRLTGSFRGTA